MRVVVALIFNAAGEVLIARRPLEKSHGGLWEFPGGKVEAGESDEAACVREIREEVGLQVLETEFLGSVNHQYGSFSVNLQVFRVTRFKGVAQRLENQPELLWVSPSKLDAFTFPEANHAVMRLCPELLAADILK
ncbi:Mutator protein MutT [Legionella geestiana]|uniref:8-oxo-dGTP diphosphatase n=1 Tax=Legionella geestiana TaxID=45065 RepID=A0A0W0TPA5_9GAMM|nr:(deoxy)nucleoside triphosphate pyrophosphohydrolase [Legionella geestiana]KTC97427.1 Mutator protein MutT [Legionella geestiana]QBS11267.1 (deoxy)nucleoside triphosphate pyrophosphohydrolase [Legionella geestiana]QDQ40962.1 (deoxy)nucleoside triphosphate pyrophosphohydrolase [Legionella geestiana]STX54104.1 mutator MutT protein [Legionella geestiana]